MTDLLYYQRPYNDAYLETNTSKRQTGACATEQEMAAFLAEQANYLHLQLDVHNGQKNLVAYFKPFPIKYYNWVKRWHPRSKKATHDWPEPRTPRKPAYGTIFLQLYHQVRMRGPRACTELSQYGGTWFEGYSRNQALIQDDQYGYYEKSNNPQEYGPYQLRPGMYKQYRQRDTWWIGPFTSLPKKDTNRTGWLYDNHILPLNAPYGEKFKYYLTPEDARRGYKVLISNVQAVNKCTWQSEGYYRINDYKKAEIVYKNSGHGDQTHTMYINRFLIVTLYMGQNRKHQVFNQRPNFIDNWTHV